MTDFIQGLATQGYAAARRAAGPDARDAAAGPDFGAVARSVTERLDRAEATARAAMTGGADPHALVEALASSQTAIETVATVRDRVVEAYQEILRMPV
jgi:flagellar hook-basal body complex protein FliE